LRLWVWFVFSLHWNLICFAYCERLRETIWIRILLYSSFEIISNRSFFRIVNNYIVFLKFYRLCWSTNRKNGLCTSIWVQIFVRNIEFWVKSIMNTRFNINLFSFFLVSFCFGGGNTRLSRISPYILIILKRFICIFSCTMECHQRSCRFSLRCSTHLF